MKRIFIPVFFLFLSLCSSAQDAKKSRFSAGLNIGYKTTCGLGLIVSYHPHPVVQVDLMGGYTRYNGAKFGGGMKIYPYNKGRVKPFISACYSMSTGANVETSFQFTQHEHYRTYVNNYIISGLGITVHGEDISHSLQVGYSLPINELVVTKYPSPTNYYQNYEKVVNSIKGGIMVTYNLFLFFNKPKKR